MAKIKSGIAMLNVLQSWGVDHIYGIPGGSINSIMDALYHKRDTMRYIQVRHEEVGALAASADAKLTGKIGVCFGSAGPGATHLFNGLYDAQLDRVPVLAIIGQVASSAMNYDAFQEMNENPMFADVSVYNRTVMTPQSLPHVVDEAIRRAYEFKGVAIITVPVDFGFVDIDDTAESNAKSHKKALPAPQPQDIDAAAKLIQSASRPVLYIGQGCKGAAAEVLKVSQAFSMPIVFSVLAKVILPDDTPNLMGSAGRLSTKPANECLLASDLILFVGSDFPFAKYYFPQDAKFIQIDIDSSRLGRRHRADIAIMADAKQTLAQLAAKSAPNDKAAKWLEANKQNRQNWLKYVRSFDDSDDTPLRPEPVFKEINRIAKDNAIFIADVGNCTIFAARFLQMNGKQQFATSGLFATMGFGIPGGIAAKLSYPNRQVITLNGDGAFAMVLPLLSLPPSYCRRIISALFLRIS